MASLLDKLQRKPKGKKPVIVIYSKHGAGKTSFAAQFTKPVFLIHSKEDGIGDLKSSYKVDEDIPVCTANDWETVEAFVDSLITEPHDLKTFVLDELGGFETILHEYVGRVEFNGDMTEQGFYSFQNGPNKIAPLYFEKFLSKLERLRDERDMAIVILSHSKIKSFTDPQRPAYDRIIPSCGEKTASAVLEWATTVGFIDFVIEVANPDGKHGKKRARGGSQRLMHLTQSAVFEAKNRWGITEPVDMGDTAEEAFANFSKAVQEAIETNKNNRKPE